MVPPVLLPVANLQQMAAGAGLNGSEWEQQRGRFADLVVDGRAHDVVRVGRMHRGRGGFVESDHMRADHRARTVVEQVGPLAATAAMVWLLLQQQQRLP